MLIAALALAVATSQSPSLRGSGRFARKRPVPAERAPSLNPLHCGAVVASADRARKEAERRGLNPLHCGAVVASGGGSGAGAGRRAVSIPFIAGQWSLPEARMRKEAERRCVSIPFIAGQWSLPPHGGWAKEEPKKSQSPSLRGSGRFGAHGQQRGDLYHVSIPFIAGQWSLPNATLSTLLGKPSVSIPFIAGQWSLPGAAAGGARP